MRLENRSPMLQPPLSYKIYLVRPIRSKPYRGSCHYGFGLDIDFHQIQNLTEFKAFLLAQSGEELCVSTHTNPFLEIPEMDHLAPIWNLSASELEVLHFDHLSLLEDIQK